MPPAWTPRRPIHDAAAALPPGLDAFAVSASLRRTLDAEGAREAAELYQLRHRARTKFADAGGLWLTRKGLEQASDQRVAAVRAARIASWVRSEAPGAWVMDATAGVGGDTLALLGEGLARVVAADADERMARVLDWNLTAGGWPGRVVCQRAEEPSLVADVLLLDPDRRRDGVRIGDPDLWSPRFADCIAQAARCRAACLKLAPALDVDRLELPASLPHAWSWVSLRGELKEVVLWTGGLAREWSVAGADPGREVIAIAGNGTAIRWSGAPCAAEPLDVEAARAVRYLADPDPGVLRSGLLGALAGDEGMRPLAPQIAYLGGDRPPTSGLLQSFEVLGSAPLRRKRVGALLKEHGIGPLTVKKRGHPDDASEIARQMRGRGANRGTLVVTRLGDGHYAYLVRALAPA